MFAEHKYLSILIHITSDIVVYSKEVCDGKVKAGEAELVLVAGMVACIEQLYACCSLKSVKCYPGGRKIHFIQSILKIQSQTGYHCVQYTRSPLMGLISHC